MLAASKLPKQCKPSGYLYYQENIQANEKLPHAHKLRSFSEYESKHSLKHCNVKASALDCNNYWNKVKNIEESKKQKLELLTFEREEQMKSMMTDRPRISKVY